MKVPDPIITRLPEPALARARAIVLLAGVCFLAGRTQPRRRRFHVGLDTGSRERTRRRRAPKRAAARWNRPPRRPAARAGRSR